MLCTAAVTAVLLLVLLVISSPTPPEGLFQSAEPGIASPLFLPAARLAEPVVAWLQYTFAAWVILGVVMLYLRYQRSPSQDRRRIRSLLVGMGTAIVVFAAVTALSYSVGSGSFGLAAVFVLWSLAVVIVLGSLIVASSQDGVFGIDRSARRSLVYRALWLMIAVALMLGGAATRAAGQPLPAGRTGRAAGRRRHPGVPAGAAQAGAAGGPVGVR